VGKVTELKAKLSLDSKLTTNHQHIYFKTYRDQEKEDDHKTKPECRQP